MTILGNAIRGYLHRMGEPKRFAFHQWNYFNYDGSSTSNNVEGWHSRLKKVVGKPHPNVYELVDIIRREEANTDDGCGSTAAIKKEKSSAARLADSESFCQIYC